jgi:hypothetical protein
VLDHDGTLWLEEPVPFQAAFMVDRPRERTARARFEIRQDRTSVVAADRDPAATRETLSPAPASGTLPADSIPQPVRWPRHRSA